MIIFRHSYMRWNVGTFFSAAKKVCVQLLQTISEHKRIIYAIFFNREGFVLEFPWKIVLYKIGIKGDSYWYHYHDNAPAHKLKLVTYILSKEVVIVVIPHPAYSPDLPLCDLFFFTKLKSHLAGRRYNSRSNSSVCLPKEEYKKHFRSEKVYTC